MDLEDLNKQMLALETEFHNNQSNKTNQQSQSNQSTISFSNVDTVNFQEIKSPIDTAQIKRPTKSGEHRGEINDKMNKFKTGMNALYKEIDEIKQAVLKQEGLR